jgi:hypothetical protein
MADPDFLRKRLFFLSGEEPLSTVPGPAEMLLVRPLTAAFRRLLAFLA